VVTLPAPPDSYTLSLHDALPILDQLISGAVHDPHAILGAHPEGARTVVRTLRRGASSVVVAAEGLSYPMERVHPGGLFETTVPRSEEHTSELQSLRHLVCRLLLE